MYVDDIVCITNEPFKDKLEQLETVFHQLRLNTQALRRAKEAWTQAGHWITHSRSPLTVHRAQGTRPNQRTRTVPLRQDVKLPKGHGNAMHAHSVPDGYGPFQPRTPKGQD